MTNQQPTPLPSPNCDSRDGHAIDMLVLHYTGMKDGARAMDRLTDPTAEVSAHYVVDEQGQAFALVSEDMRAWHAGKAYWRGHTNINQRSIGIEIVNPGHEFGYRPFPEKQMLAVIALCKDILSRHDIPAHNVVGHSDVAPTRKQDPGELFDWARLAEAGVGHWGLGIRGKDNPQSPMPNPQCLVDYGYEAADKPTITAFQRHFRPSNISGQWDEECGRILQNLLDSDH